jgi:hypothetical protein
MADALKKKSSLVSWKLHACNTQEVYYAKAMAQGASGGGTSRFEGSMQPQITRPMNVSYVLNSVSFVDIVRRGWDLR